MKLRGDESDWEKLFDEMMDECSVEQARDRWESQPILLAATKEVRKKIADWFDSEVRSPDSSPEKTLVAQLDAATYKANPVCAMCGGTGRRTKDDTSCLNCHGTGRTE